MSTRFGDRIELGYEIWETVADIKFVRVWISSGGLNLLDLLFAVGFVLRWVKFLIISCGGILLGLVRIFSSLNESIRSKGLIS
jgi:hypothetical protein